MGQKEHDILIQARDLMNDGGKHWNQGEYYGVNENGEKTYCALGAVYAALGEQGLTPDVQPERYEAALDVLEFLGAAIGTIDIVNWNDTRRSWRQVDRAFKKAARQAAKA